MASEPVPDRQHYTVVAERIDGDAWHVTIRELPRTWTVAFTLDEIEWRARQRIAYDLWIDPSGFDVTVLRDGR
jgi:predicted RNase H-like HicB family nuclease